MDTIGNITVSTKYTGMDDGICSRNLTVSYNRGNIANTPLMNKVVTPSKIQNLQIWKQNVKTVLPEITRDDILEMILQEILLDLPDMDFMEEGSENVDNDCQSDISDSIDLRHSESNLLCDILKALQKIGKKDIWVTSVQECYSNITLLIPMQLINHLSFQS